MCSDPGFIVFFSLVEVSQRFGIESLENTLYAAMFSYPDCELFNMLRGVGTLACRVLES